MRIFLWSWLAIMLVVVGVLGSSRPLLAAQLMVISAGHSLVAGTEFDVTLQLATAKDDINAVEGVVVYPVDLLEITAVRTGSSIVSLWVEKPTATNSGRMPFSGAIIGGFVGSAGNLFTLHFRALKAGNGEVGIEKLQVLSNDGRGSVVASTVAPWSFGVVNQALPSAPPASVGSVTPIVIDTVKPESFTPIISQNPAIFDGKKFIVFDTQDKQSGIDHYEVSEGNGPWIKAQSPYVLLNQLSDVSVRVKAVDVDGNERIEEVVRQVTQPQWSPYIFLLVALLVGLVLAALIAGQVIIKRR